MPQEAQHISIRRLSADSKSSLITKEILLLNLLTALSLEIPPLLRSPFQPIPIEQVVPFSALISFVQIRRAIFIDGEK